jgi:hypothetical protein
MRGVIAIVVVLSLLAGCAETDRGGLLDSSSPPPATAWVDANARYSEKLRRARDYARRCQSDLAMARTSCQDTINDLNRVDIRAEAIQNQGHAALGDRDLRRLADAIDSLDEAGSDLDRTLTAGAP